jgi:hypothetical protein
MAKRELGAVDVHVFLATGAATKANGADYRAGERYSLLIFSRQPIGENPDRQRAGKGATAAGWKDVKLERSRRLPSGATPGDPVLREAFGEALAEGSAVVAYKEPVSI